MTAVSIGIMGGYIFLQVLVIILVWRALRDRFPEGKRAKAARFLVIFFYSLFSAVPVAATFVPEGPLDFALSRVGNIFLAFDTHFGCIFLALSFFLWLARFRQRGKMRAPYVAMLLALIAGLIIPVYGMVHARQPVVSYRTADLCDGAPQTGSLRVALIADLHLGVNSQVSTTEKMVDLLNEQSPDLVLFAGDLFTSSYHALREPEKHAAALSRIRSRLGTYAVYGNHDVEEKLFAGFAIHSVEEAFRSPEIEQFFRNCGFTVLEDETVWIGDTGICLAGRKDRMKSGDGTSNHSSAEELLRGVDKDALTLVLEHEPVEYTELAQAGADLVFSGHTHNGQIFPGNLYVRIANINAYGQKRVHGMETFVTSGVGTFGPPMRTATNSEVMIIDLTY